MENDHEPLALGQRAHRTDELVEHLTVLERVNGAQLTPARGVVLALAPQLVDREVDGDPLEPRPERARRVEPVE